MDDGANVEFIPYNFDPPYAYEGDIVRFCSADEDGDEVYFDVEVIQDCSSNYGFGRTMSSAKMRHKNPDIYDVLDEFVTFEKPSFPLKYRYDGLGDRQFVEIIQNTYGVIENDIQAIIFKKIEIFEEPFERPKEVSTDKVLARHHMEFVEAMEYKKQVSDIANEVIIKAWQCDFSVSETKADNDLALFKEMFERLLLKREWLDYEEVEREFAKISLQAYKTFESVMKDLCDAGIAYRFKDDEFYGIENYYYACNDKIMPNPKALTPKSRNLQNLIVQMLDANTPYSASEISIRLDASFEDVIIALNELVRIGKAWFSGGGHYYATTEDEHIDIENKIPTLSQCAYDAVNMKLANKKRQKR